MIISEKHIVLFGAEKVWWHYFIHPRNFSSANYLLEMFDLTICFPLFKL